MITFLYRGCKKNTLPKYNHKLSSGCQRGPKSRLFHFQMYQIVPKRGAKQQDRTRPQHQFLGTVRTVLLPLWGAHSGLGQADHNTDDPDTLREPARKIYAKKDRVCMHAHACTYCEGEASGGGRHGRRNVIASSNSLSCQVLCQRSCNRT